MSLTFQQLRAFHAIAKHESITKGAKSLQMTQPAASMQLKNLQDQFDVPLTEVIGKQIHITEFGEEIVKMAERIFDEINMIDQRMLELKGLLAGKIRISSVSTGKYIIPYFMSEFMKIHPHVEISLEVSNRFQVLADLEKNSTDVALLSIAPEDPNLKSLLLSENEWYMVSNPENQSLYQELIDRNEWTKIPYILREKGSGTRVMMEKFLESKKTVPHKNLEFATNEAVKQAVLAGLGATLLSKFSVQNELSEGKIVILKANGMELKEKWKLMWLKQKKHSPAVLAFIRWMATHSEQIFEQLIKEKVAVPGS